VSKKKRYEVKHLTKLNKLFKASLNGALNFAIKKLNKKVRESFLKLKNWIDKLLRAIISTMV
jgi:hypothetical protein